MTIPQSLSLRITAHHCASLRLGDSPLWIRYAALKGVCCKASA